MSILQGLLEFHLSGHFSHQLATTLQLHLVRRLQRQGYWDQELQKEILSRIFLKLAHMQQQQSPFWVNLPNHSESLVVGYINRMITTSVVDAFREMDDYLSYEMLLEEYPQRVDIRSCDRQEQEHLADIYEAIQHLSPIQQFLITHYYVDEWTLAVLKNNLGLSLAKVHREIKKSMACLRQLLQV